MSLHSQNVLHTQLVALKRLKLALEAVQSKRKTCEYFSSHINLHVLKASVLSIPNIILRLHPQEKQCLELFSTFQDFTESAQLWLNDPQNHPDLRFTEQKLHQSLQCKIQLLERRISPSGREQKRALRSEASECESHKSRLR
jgi:hypothetical protein